MQTENYKVEAATCAHSSGNLTWDSWSHDVITAVGVSGVRNPLGFAIVRYLSESSPTRSDIMAVVDALTGQINRSRIKTDNAQETAARAMLLWSDSRCPKCQGRGVLNFEQVPCRACGGTGQRDYAGVSSAVKASIEILAEYELMMERQLRTRLKGREYAEPDGKRLMLPSAGAPYMDIGNGGSVTLPIKPGRSY